MLIVSIDQYTHLHTCIPAYLHLYTYLRIICTQVINKLLPLGGASDENDVTVYSEGGLAMEAMWEAIDAAKERIIMEAYIFKYADTYLYFGLPESHCPMLKTCSVP